MNGIADYIAKELETETFQKQLTTAAVDALKKQISENVGWQAQASVRETIKAWFDDNAVNVIKEAFNAELPNIEAELKRSVSLAAAEIGKALVTAATKNMSESYKRDEVVKRIFG